MKKMKCKRCFASILGNMSVDTYRYRVGKQVVLQTDYYCAPCFRQLNVERSWNVYRNKKAAAERANNS